jgi:hypothetical protein
VWMPRAERVLEVSCSSFAFSMRHGELSHMKKKECEKQFSDGEDTKKNLEDKIKDKNQTLNNYMKSNFQNQEYWFQISNKIACTLHIRYVPQSCSYAAGRNT